MTPKLSPAQKFTYRGREVTVIQYDNKTHRVEVTDSHKYTPTVAGFWVNETELTAIEL